MNENTINIDGTLYNTTDISEDAYKLVRDLDTIQNEMNRIKTSYDIVSLARQAILNSTKGLIESGNSGLVVVEDSDAQDGSNDESISA